MINPNVVEGQIAGGVVQGIGGALLEQLAYDDDGQSGRHHVHGLPAADGGRRPADRIRARRDRPSPDPGGYKGVGEGGAIGAPPAVVNAVADALAPFGVTITRTPLTPAAIVALLEEAGA